MRQQINSDSYGVRRDIHAVWLDKQPRVRFCSLREGIFSAAAKPLASPVLQSVGAIKARALSVLDTPFEASDVQSFWLFDQNRQPIWAPLDPVVLLARHRDVSERIRLTLGDEQLFSEHVLPQILAWGAFVQGLPMAPHGVFSSDDGLFEAGLWIGLESLRQMDGHVFGSDKAPLERAMFEKRLRIAVFFAGLVSEVSLLSRLCVQAGVYRESERFSASDTFAPVVEPLLRFALRHRDETLMFTWRKVGKNDGYFSHIPTLHYISHLLSASSLRWLSDGGSIFEAMQSAIIKAPLLAPIAALISDCVTRGSLAAMHRRARALASQTGCAPQLLGWGGVMEAALRYLLENGKLTLNERPLYWGSDGLFLEWPQAAGVICETIAERGYIEDMTDDVWLMAAVLCRSGICIASRSGAPIHLIRPPESAETKEALLFACPDTFLAAVARTQSVSMRPPTMPLLLENLSSKRNKAHFEWKLHLPERTPAPLIDPLKRALDTLNGKPLFAQRQANGAGVFLDESLFCEPPLDAFAHSAMKEGLFVPSRINRCASNTLGHSLLGDVTPFWRVIKGKTARTGVILSARFVLPKKTFQDGESTQLPWPATDFSLSEIDEALKAGIR